MKDTAVANELDTVQRCLWIHWYFMLFMLVLVFCLFLLLLLLTRKTESIPYGRVRSDMFSNYISWKIFTGEQSRQCFLAMWRLHFSWERYRQKKQENKKMTQYVDAWETVEKSKGLGCGAAHTGCRIKSIDQVDLLRKQEQRLKIRTWVSQADVEGKMF